MVNLPSLKEVLEEMKLEVFRLGGEKVLEFQEEQIIAWFGKRWEREREDQKRFATELGHQGDWQGSQR